MSASLAGTARAASTKMELQFCNLSAYAWCFDCNMYVCDIHLAANHVDQHQTIVEFPKQTFTPGTTQVRMAR